MPSKTTPLSCTDLQEGSCRHSHMEPSGVTLVPQSEILNFLNKALLFQHALGHQFMELVPVASVLDASGRSGMTLAEVRAGRCP